MKDYTEFSLSVALLGLGYNPHDAVNLSYHTAQVGKHLRVLNHFLAREIQNVLVPLPAQELLQYAPRIRLRFTQQLDRLDQLGVHQAGATEVAGTLPGGVPTLPIKAF